MDFYPEAYSSFLRVVPYIGLAILLFGLPIFFTALYLIWAKSHATVGRGFKILYSLMVVSAMLMHIFSYGFIPLVVPPYRIAMLTVGLLSEIGISSNLQTALCFTFLYALVISNASLLYYRMNLLLPTHHVLNKNWIRALLYSFMYCSVPPSLLVWYAVGHFNQEKGKFHYYWEFGNIALWPLVNSSAVVYEISIENELLWVLVIYVAIFLIIPGLLIIALFAYCLQLLKKVSQTISKKTAQLHSSFLSTIISQVAVEAIVFLIPFIIMVILFFLRTERVDIIFILECMFGTSSACCILSMIVANKTYRSALIGLFKREKKEPEYFQKGTAIFEASQRQKTPIGSR